MGCMNSKGSRHRRDRSAAVRSKGSGRLSRHLIPSSHGDHTYVARDKGSDRLISSSSRNHTSLGRDKGSHRLISTSRRDEHATDSVAATRFVSRTSDDSAEKPAEVRSGGKQRRECVERTVDGGSRIVAFPNGVEAECVAAGWPSWLASVAGESLRGWVPRRADSFEKLDKIGQGTYSSVYKARDLETNKIVALKKVKFASVDPESVRFMAREIHILRKLDHQNIVKLEGLVTSKTSSGLYLVFEYMEHDLAGLAATRGIKFSEPQIKCYMQQILSGLEHCHNHGVLHRDIKGANLLIDNNGILKIADFGLATFFNPEKTQQFTSRVVTLWYRPPELLLGAAEYGAAVDLWSAGCILAELLAGKPIMPGRTEVEQLHKIFKLCGSPSEEYWRRSKLPHATIFKPQHPYRRCIRDVFKDFSPSALALLDVILSVEPEYRGTATSALKSEFFTSKPLACDPSTLPKYPPSKEFDVKLRDEESRRQRAAAIKGQREADCRQSKATQAAAANGEHGDLVRRRAARSKDKSSSDRYTILEGSKDGSPIGHDALHEKIREDNHRSLTGRSLSSSRGMGGREVRGHRSYLPLIEGCEINQMRGLIPARNSRKLDNQNERSNRQLWPEQRSRYNQVDAAETSEKQEWACHLLDKPSSSQKKLVKEPSMGHSGKNRIHYSGPLVPADRNVEEMLKEHERQIQHAVRRSRGDRTRMMRIYG